MTGRRWDSSAIAGAKSARGAVFLTSLALAAVLFTGILNAAFAQGGTINAPAAEKGAAASGAAIGSLTVGAEKEAVKLSFASRGKIAHHVSVSENPPGAVVRIENATFESLPPKVTIGDGVVETVEFTRIGTDAVISLKLAKPAGVTAQVAQAGFEILVGGEVALAPAPAPAAPAAAPAIAAAEKPKAEFSVKVEEKLLTFSMGAAPSKIDALLLSDGLRLVVDLKDASVPGGQYVNDYAEGPVSKIAMRQNGESVRCVIEARGYGRFEGFAAERTGEGFTLRMPGKPVEEKAAVKAAPAPEPALVVAAAKSSTAKGGGMITDLGFHQDPEKSYVDIAFSKSADYEVSEVADKKVVLDVKDTALTDKFRRALDTSEFKGPVSMISAYQRGPHTRVVVELRATSLFKLIPAEKGISIAFEGGKGAPVEAPKAEEKEKIVLVTPEGKKYEEAAPAVPAAAADKPKSGKTAYTGQRISMDFVEADIRNILRIIGEISNLNIVTGSEVSGKMTIRLVDIPWDQALDVILKAKGLDKEIEGNVMRIVAAEKLAGERAARVAAEVAEVKAKEDTTPLASDIIPVSYATAKEINENIKTLLSKRGSATIDARTNIILIRDLPENIDNAKKMVARLDTPTPQVLIEARIVEIRSTFNKELGIQWGGAFNADPSRGNAPSNGFPNAIGLRGDTGLSNYAVNLPTASAGKVGAIALSLGSVNDILSLDMKLMAMETSGKARLVSSPRVATLDNKPAEISQGYQIPIATATQEKIEKQLIDYLLKLTVTPHVTSDNSILLKIDIKKDDIARESIDATGASAPPKASRSAMTEVLVRDGDTTVIGGIVSDEENQIDYGIPWFRNIPVLGWFFENKSNTIEKKELIIFITPRIIRLDVAKYTK